MSYESTIFKKLALPNRDIVIRSLLTAMLKHNGRVKEFGSGDQEFTDELADMLNLSNNQRTFKMETIVRKEGRLKRWPAWNRLLFRTADYAAKQGFLVRPKITFKLTGIREWMLTEKGIDQALNYSRIPIEIKQELPIVTYEVQQIKNELEDTAPSQDYDPVDTKKRLIKTTKQSLLRNRGFRQAIIQAYNYKCCLCGLKISSPNSFIWEVEAAHIVPHRYYGKDDICNGIALCRFHHWLFDVGWFAIRQDYSVEVNPKLFNLPSDYGLMSNYNILRMGINENQTIILPLKQKLFPHMNAISWHRINIFGYNQRIGE